MSNLKCWVGPCGFDARGTYDVAQFDGEGAGLMLLTLWPGPAPSGTRPRDASTLCRWHLLEKAETALAAVKAAEPTEPAA